MGIALQLLLREKQVVLAFYKKSEYSKATKGEFIPARDQFQDNAALASG